MVGESSKARKRRRPPIANGLFQTAKEELLSGQINFSSGGDNVKLVLVDNTNDAITKTGFSYLSDLTESGGVATSGNFTNQSVTDGTFDADDVTLTSVTGDEAEHIVIYQDTGTASTSTLVVHIDTATGLPVTPNGGDITITFDASGIFSL